MKALALVTLVVACSDPAHAPDAAVAHDAARDAAPDSRPDAPIDAAPGPAVGMIEVAQGTGDGSAAAGATASFGPAAPFGSAVGTDGPCTLYALTQGLPGFSAGAISITGTASPVSLTPSGTAPSVRYSTPAVLTPPVFTAGDTLTFTAAGGPDVGAFTASTTAPATLTGFTAPTTISRAGYTATWTAGTGPLIWVIVVAIDNSSGNGDEVVCRVDDTGSFTVPATTFAMLPATATDSFVGIGRVSPMTTTVGSTMVTVQATSFVTSGQVTITN